MARPHKPISPVCYKPSLRLYPGEDDDLIAYLEQEQANGASLAQAIIQAMRGGVRDTLAEVGDDSLDIAALVGNLFFD